MEIKPLSLLWLRRDLRLRDHAPLAAALKAQLPVQPAFVFDTDILARFKSRDDRRLTFIAEAVCQLHEELRSQGCGLLVLHGRAQELIPRLASRLNARGVYAGADFEPATRARDKQTHDELAKMGIAFTRVKDHLLLAPHEVLKEDGTPYKVFTPYANAWRHRTEDGKPFSEHAVNAQGRYADYANTLACASGLPVVDIAQGAKHLLRQIGYDRQELLLWPVKNAQHRLARFIDTQLEAYHVQRDFMGIDGTSRLSPYLRFGLISIRECARLAAFHTGEGAAIWLKELIWRDFYAMILFHFPETQALEFQPQTRGLQWNSDISALEAFTEGRTGYPIIDAAMRELKATGYMHNRARMIVACFMTKDLLLDWRLGEEHFAQLLMDYELASNVGGWQWAASTGTDAQPYFRVFNPVLQSKKYDPEGNYIRAFVPELAKLAVPDIHEPWKNARPDDYPPPIVDHGEMKAKAIAMFKKADAEK